MTRVKICGVRDPETAVVAAKAGADFIGMVFAESRRRVTSQQCYDIVGALHELGRGDTVAHFGGPERGDVPGRSWFAAWNEAIDDSLTRWRPLIVGVFAGQSAAEVAGIANAAKLDIVQLSGGEGREFIDELSTPAVQVIHVGEDTTTDDVIDHLAVGSAKALMLDTASASAKGGTGETFDWSVAAEVGASRPLMLAGGLSLENVAEAVAVADPWAVDISSGVEIDGTKDHEEIRAFIKAAKGARVG
jgi:phosphoribosylanthranilate isomerase